MDSGTFYRTPNRVCVGVGATSRLQNNWTVVSFRLSVAEQNSCKSRSGLSAQLETHLHPCSNEEAMRCSEEARQPSPCHPGSQVRDAPGCRRGIPRVCLFPLSAGQPGHINLQLTRPAAWRT
jgi:hypothetical protein